MVVGSISIMGINGRLVMKSSREFKLFIEFYYNIIQTKFIRPFVFNIENMRALCIVITSNIYS